MSISESELGFLGKLLDFPGQYYQKITWVKWEFQREDIKKLNIALKLFIQ